MRPAPVCPLAILSIAILTPAVAFAQITLPFSEGFEGTSGEVYTIPTVALVGALDWSYSNGGTAGRLRTAAGPGYPRTGAAAVTLDRSPAGASQINYLTLNLDLSAYTVAVDTVVLDFAFMDHGEDPSPNDRVWVRGAAVNPWVEIADLNALAAPVGTYAVIEDINVSGALAAAGQDFSASTAIRFGQEDDSPSTGIANGDGLTFDDIDLRLIDPLDVAATGVLAPGVGECGNDTMMVDVEITNLGGTSVSNVPVDVTVTASDGVVTTVSGVVAGPLGFLESEVVSVGPVDLFVGGLTDFEVTPMLTGDFDPGNDVWTETVDLGAGAVPLDPIDGACPGFPTTLTIQAEGATTYTWWDAPTGGSSLGTGPAYTTPALTSEATYWISRLTSSGAVGAIDNTIGIGGDFSDYSDGLLFDVGVPAVLESVLVYADGPGDLVVNLEDSTGALLDSVTTAVADGANVVNLGFDLPVGTGYRLTPLGSTVSNLYRNTGGAAYPYASAGGEITVTGAINGLSAFYYYFYDWQFTAGGCDEARTEVVVPVGIAECDTDLAVSVTGPEEVVPGTSVEYGVTVLNEGPDPLTDYEIAAPVPAGLAWSSGAGDCTQLPCALSTLAPGASVSFTTTYTVPPDYDTAFGVDYVASAAPTGGETDPDPSDDAFTLSLPAVAHADLRVDVVEDADPAYVGGMVSFLVEVENLGPSDASGVLLRSTLPEEFSLASTALDACAEADAGVPDCSLGTLSAGAATDVLYEVPIPLATVPTQVTSIWTAISDAVDDVEGNELWAEFTEIAVGADLELDATIGPGTIAAGGEVALHLRVLNRGPDLVTNPVLHLQLPPGAQAARTPSGCTAELVCELDALALGQSAAIDFPIAIDPSATGSILLRAEVSSERIDPEEDDNVVEVSLTLETVADLVIDVSDVPRLEAGTAVDVSVTARNLGPSDLTDVEVVFDLPPAGLSVPDCELDALRDTVCAVGPVSVGEGETIAVSLRADEGAFGVFEVPVFLRSSGSPIGDLSDERVVLRVDVGPIDDDDDVSCEGCSSSVASPRAGPAWLLALLLMGLRRRR